MKRVFVWFIVLLCFVSCGNIKPKEAEFVVLFTTDLYGFILPYDFQADKPGRAGVANFATLVEEQRALYGDHCLVFDNGDKLTGGPTAFYYNFVDTVSEPICFRSERIINYDAVNLGYRDMEISECLANKRHDPSTLPQLLCSNLIDTRTGKPYFKPYEIFERDGIKIAVIGFISPLVSPWLPKSEWKYLETQDMIEAASYWMNEVQDQHHPDMVIALCNSSVKYDMFGRDMNTYKNPHAGVPMGVKVPGFDLVLLGCADNCVNIALENEEGKEVLFVQPGQAGNYCGKVHIQMKRQSNGEYEKKIDSNIIDLSTIPPSERFCHALKTANDSIYRWFNEPIGYLADSIFGPKGLYGPDFFRHFVNTAQLWWSGADISFASLLRPKDTICSGDVTMREVFSIYPFEHQPQLLRMNGEDIRQYLEWSSGLQFETMKKKGDPMIKLRHDHSGNVVFSENGAPYLDSDPTFFTSAGGIRYNMDISKPEGQRITIKEMFNGEKFDPRKDYTVVINSFQANDGGEFISKGLRWDVETMAMHAIPTPSSSMRLVLRDYIQHIDTVRFEYKYQWHVVPNELWVEGKQREQVLFPQPIW